MHGHVNATVRESLGRRHPSEKRKESREMQFVGGGAQPMSSFQPTDQDTAQLIDHRTASRYPLEIPVDILLEDGDRLGVLTRNVSASGILVNVAGYRRLENHPRFLITFPREITTSGRLLALCDGAVVRREKYTNDSEGVAIKIERYHFLRSI